jgi:hypothetical protein
MLFWQQMHLLATTGLITLSACTLAFYHTWPSSIHHALASHIILTAVFAFLFFNFPQTSLSRQLTLLFALPFRTSFKFKTSLKLLLKPEWACSQLHRTPHFLLAYQSDRHCESFYPTCQGFSHYSQCHWEFLSYLLRFLSLLAMPLALLMGGRMYYHTGYP